MKKIIPFSIILFFSISIFSQETETYFKSLKFRNIGPFQGGRSVAVSGTSSDPFTYYMGSTGGGLWKTVDAGQSWKNISDTFFKTGSVGAVAVSESNPNIVYCGMGEHAVRAVMTSYGDGVYKSTDAGKTWKKIGLDKTQHISRIVIHPTNPNIVYVAAQGALYGPSKERGIYKSIDGGKTWNNVLFINELTGCSEISLDVNFPEIIYAAMWHHQRKPWKIISGGSGSGLYKSVDGGETWKPINKGIPKEKGKTAISVCPSNSSKVYALIESDTNKDLGGLFVSSDAGEKWTKVSGDNRLTQRAWYYTEVFTDPNNDNVVYVLSAPALKSIDGGKNWTKLSGTHTDFHDLWINPNNSKNMVIANDGGAGISFNSGKSWSTQSNMPIAQIYRLNADNLFPYNIYGGQQDFPSLKISSLSYGNPSITESDWSNSAGGESAFLAFDPDNPKYVMGGSYLGSINVLNTESNTRTKVMAAPIQYLGEEARNMKYLYNWNAPILKSKHNTNTFYHCAQLVLETKDMGSTWKEISKDLTRNLNEKQGKGGGPYTNEAVGGENYGTISYMAEAPQEKGVFYTGSDDGLVHLSRDNGNTWINITPKDLKECLINAIEISTHNQGTAYIATTRFKFNDHTPAIYKTTDYGKSWKNISSNIPYGAFTRVIRESPTKKDLLFCGTEKGVFISWDGGQNWKSFQLNLPITPITDLKIHKGDLIVATSGRGIWILDDLTILSQYKGKTGSLKLYKPKNAYRGYWGSQLNNNNNKFKGMSTFSGVNPANGVVIYYELPKFKDSTHIKLEIKNSSGELIRFFTSKKDSLFKKYEGGPPTPSKLDKKEGLNRIVWDMRHKTMPGVQNVYIEGSYKGHLVSPDIYHITLKIGDSISSNSVVKIVETPFHRFSRDNYKAYDSFMTEMEQNLTDMHKYTNVIFDLKRQLNVTITFLKKTPENKELITEATNLVKKLKKWDDEMVQRKSKAYDDVENFQNKFTANYLFLINQSENILPLINQSSRDRKEELDKKWIMLKEQAKTLIKEDIPDYNKKLWDKGIGAIKVK
ncbi:WD40/YVTN/BNR-like repeat-containing protein [Seonamhaeicola maritimus]|uniref:WD40/YVTN/BNR-like repeat-containing protein n=1 Tax=Seonamhaeicola maritimus TaxID=2591822 RepID=UPI0024952676|nr:glycosyl hydrolase [Seonamhaeicola maritimus]